jgi:hypothetical protein
MGGPVWFDKIFQACHGPTSFIAYERGLVIFEYSHVFRSGGPLMTHDPSNPEFILHLATVSDRNTAVTDEMESNIPVQKCKMSLP